jgi:hypothetical protein
MHWFDVQCELVSGPRHCNERETEWPRGEFDNWMLCRTGRSKGDRQANEQGDPGKQKSDYLRDKFARRFRSIQLVFTLVLSDIPN